MTIDDLSCDEYPLVVTLFRQIMLPAVVLAAGSIAAEAQSAADEAWWNAPAPSRN